MRVPAAVLGEWGALWRPPLAGVAFWLMASPAAAQVPADTTRFEVEPIVVTADRAAAPLATSTTAVSVLSAEELRRLPVRTVADALQRIPGFTLLSFDGLGYDPKVVVRGFYGGGETDHVVVMVNGRPLNGLSHGLVPWDLVPLSTVERIEVVRGGASALYGDAATGAAINIITRPGAAPGGFRGSLSGGGYGLVRGSASLDSGIGGRAASIFGSMRRSHGFRSHSERFVSTVGGSIALLGGDPAALTLSTLNHWQEHDEPGPLPGPDLAQSRTQISPYHRLDRNHERRHRVALEGRTPPGRTLRATGYLVAEAGRADAVRTLPLSADFADTKAREAETGRLLGSVQLELGSGLPFEGRLLTGVDGAVGRHDIAYFDVVTGDEAAYQGASGARGARVTFGHGGRTALAAFASYEMRPHPVLRLSVGGRVDWLRGGFELAGPEADSPPDAEHTAFSPKLGVNVRYLETATQRGHLYANWGRSFKAATLEQLFDPRPIPVPFPPYSISVSNALLAPQYGTSRELGLYHRAAVGELVARVSLAAYRMDMEDEIDFSLEEFRYVNIGRSRHDGVEAGLELTGPAGLAGRVSYALQDVTARGGELDGRQLKAIPRHTISTGASWRAPRSVGAALTTTTMRGIWLDDANTVELPGFTRVDLRLSYPVVGARLSLEVFNLLDAEYSTTGFLDPGGSDVVFYYPAAGRFLELGLAWNP